MIGPTRTWVISLFITRLQRIDHIHHQLRESFRIHMWTKHHNSARRDAYPAQPYHADFCQWARRQADFFPQFQVLVGGLILRLATLCNEMLIWLYALLAMLPVISNVHGSVLSFFRHVKISLEISCLGMNLVKERAGLTTCARLKTF